MGSAFNGTSITEVYLPTGVKITDSPFSQCHKLQYIHNLENAVIETSAGLNIIPNSFFYECRAVCELRVPNGVTSIGSNVFNRCGGDTCVAIYIPASVTSMKKDTFPKSTDWLAPKNAVIFFAGGSASDLLALTNDGEGNVSAFLKEKIENGKVVTYAGINAEYELGVIVENANTCDMYFNGKHLEGSEIFYTFVDENGKVGKAYLSALKISCPCERLCGSENIIEILPAFFTCNGYSVQENGEGGIAIGYKVNKAAIARYTELTNDTVFYGIFAASQSVLSGKEIFDENGDAIEGAFTAEMHKSLCYFDVKLVLKTEAQRNVFVALGAYVKSLKMGTEYLVSEEPTEGEAYYFVSYNQLAASLKE